jgi:hypothetical protein
MPLPISFSHAPALTRAARALVVLLIVSMVALAVDSRVITGAPAWLKPVKFCVSVLAYLLTLAWMTQPLPRTRGLRMAEAATGALLVMEVVVIGVQALRGTRSHFNVDTPLDSALFATMGIGIGIVWALSAFILVLHWRTPLADRGLALAFRLGMLVHIVGAGVGWMMTQPVPGQIAAIEQGVRPRLIGAHTVGGPDGGPGLPVTRWSTVHGDLRIPHFVGMHALQLLPLAVLLLRRLRRRPSDTIEQPLVFGLTAAWTVLFTVVLSQALAGLPLWRTPGG